MSGGLFARLGKLLSRRVRVTAATRERIVVVGAGAAGLAAARCLHDAGHEVVVVEARSRIGGRMHTMNFGSACVDVGAAHLHGVKKNPLMPFVKAGGHRLKKQRARLASVYTDAGETVDDKTVKWAVAEFDRLMVTAENMIDAGRGHETVADALSAHVSAYDDEQNVAFVRHFVAAVMEIEDGGAIDAMTLDGLFSYLELGGGNHFPIGGYSSIAMTLADGLAIRTDTKVVAISQRESGVVAELEGGETIHCDRLVCTLPLGVLKAQTVTFSPPLTTERRAAIDRLGVGRVEKVILLYETRWWAPHIRDSLGVFVEAGSATANGLCSYEDLSHVTGAPTLVCWLGGKSAFTVLDTFSADEVVSLADGRLRRALRAAEPTALVGSHVTDWYNDPFARGSYTHVPAGAKPDDLERLGAPGWGGRLLFAGEATTRTEFQSVHGAMRSGRREAERILSTGKRK